MIQLPVAGSVGPRSSLGSLVRDAANSLANAFPPRRTSTPQPEDDDQVMGFFTDTTLCIGCKACEVACKQWNQLPADNIEFQATSYDNTRSLGASTWRHVKFIEQGAESGGDPRWLFLSDICKHCEHAGCLEACPTGAIVRTEYGTVVIQQDVCNGCKYCVPACPYGVITVDKEAGGTAHQCTHCYDRVNGG